MTEQVKRRDEFIPALFGQVEIDHGSLYFGMSKKLLDGMDVRTGIQEVCSKGMPDRMCGKTILFKSCLIHGHADGMLYGAVVHSFSWSLSFKEEGFRLV